MRTYIYIYIYIWDLRERGRLSIFTSPNAPISDELSSPTQKARLAFTDLGHLQRWRAFGLRSAARNSSKVGLPTWLRNMATEHRCVYTIYLNTSVFVALLEYSGKISSGLGVGRWVLRFYFKNTETPWLDRMLDMLTERLRACTLFSKIPSSRETGWGSHRMTWPKCMEILVSRPVHVSPIRLPGWGIQAMVGDIVLQRNVVFSDTPAFFSYIIAQPTTLQLTSYYFQFFFHTQSEIQYKE